MDNDMQPVITRREGDAWVTDSYVNPCGDGVELDVRTITTDELRHTDVNIFTHTSELIDIDIHSVDSLAGTVVVLVNGVGRGHNTVSARVFLSEAQARHLVSLLHRQLDREEAHSE
jgi:hypothetical protein